MKLDRINQYNCEVTQIVCGLTNLIMSFCLECYFILANLVLYFYCFTSTLKLGRTYVGFTKYKSNHLGHDGVEPLGQCEEEADGLDGDAIPDFTNL